MHFCGHVFSVVTDKYLFERVGLIADIMKIAGIVIVCMEKILYYNALTQSGLSNEELPYAFRCTKITFII